MSERLVVGFEFDQPSTCLVSDLPDLACGYRKIGEVLSQSLAELENLRSDVGSDSCGHARTGSGALAVKPLGSFEGKRWYSSYRLRGSRGAFVLEADER